ncbi:MAG: hypothetical protein H0X65_17940 [Gemmatimonadetes bacterium]|jgi:hypothetical protein|nr:hypothetical protein [Gemmatimonadota bacterium]
MMVIKPGDRVIARSATNQWLHRRAVTGVIKGMDFPVVRVCEEEEWSKARTQGREPESFAWPAEEVKVDAEA